MSVVKTQFTRAILAYPSDNCDIPYPQEAAVGNTTSAFLNMLVDSTKNFNTLQIAAGDIVYNHTTKKGATVVNVDPSNTSRVILNANIFTGTSESYTIYANSALTSINNQGCCFFSQSGSNVIGRFMTIGGDVIDMRTVFAGAFYPIQIKKFFETGNSLNPILAVW